MAEKLIGSEGAQKFLTKDTACPSLPVKYRIWGFCISFILGIFISLLSLLLFVFGSLTNVSKFVIVYTLGNICALASSFFLFGPLRQLKLMFKTTRIIATIVCLICIIFTLVFCLVLYNPDKGGHKIVIWILFILQYVSMFWYILSYIPFARTIFKSCCKCICDCDGDL